MKTLLLHKKLKTAILAISLVAFLGMQTAPAFAQVTGDTSRYYNDSWADDLMETINMDNGEGLELVGKTAITTIISCVAAYAGGELTAWLGGGVGGWTGAAAGFVGYGVTAAAAAYLNAVIWEQDDPWKAALIGGIAGGIGGAISTSGLSGWDGWGGYGRLAATGIGAAAGAGLGYVVDKDYWWLYSLQGALSAYGSSGNNTNNTWNTDRFMMEFARGYLTRLALSAVTEMVQTQVYLDTVHYNEDTEKWEWDEDRAYLYSAVANGVMAGLINFETATGSDTKGMSGEQIAWQAVRGALIGGIGGFAGGELVITIKDMMNYDDISNTQDRREKEREFNQYAAPVLYNVGSTFATGIARAATSNTLGDQDFKVKVNDIKKVPGKEQGQERFTATVTPDREFMSSLMTPDEQAAQEGLVKAGETPTFVVGGTVNRDGSYTVDSGLPSHVIPEGAYSNIQAGSDMQMHRDDTFSGWRAAGDILKAGPLALWDNAPSLLGQAVGSGIQWNMMKGMEDDAKYGRMNYNDYMHRKILADVLGDAAGSLTSYGLGYVRGDYAGRSLLGGLGNVALGVVGNAADQAMTEALRDKGITGMEAAYLKHMGTSLLTGAVEGYNANPLMSAFMKLGDNQVNIIKEELRYGVHISPSGQYSIGEWNSFLANAKAISAPLSKATDIWDTGEKKYKTEDYQAGVYNSFTRKNISDSVTVAMDWLPGVDTNPTLILNMQNLGAGLDGAYYAKEVAQKEGVYRIYRHGAANAQTTKDYNPKQYESVKDEESASFVVYVKGSKFNTGKDGAKETEYIVESPVVFDSRGDIVQDATLNKDGKKYLLNKNREIIPVETSPAGPQIQNIPIIETSPEGTATSPEWQGVPYTLPDNRVSEGQ